MRRQSDNIDRAALVAAVEQAADGIVITDITGEIQYVNPAFTVMTGYTSEEAVGQNPRILKSNSHPVVKFQQRYVMSHRNVVNCQWAKAFDQFCSSHGAHPDSRSVLGACFRPNL